MLAFLPLVGAAVGGLAGAAGWATALVAPRALAVAVTFAALIVLTGALHVDGFLDTCDALFASVSPQQRAQILKDPHHGTFAVAYFAVASVVWLAALWNIEPVRLPLALAFAGATARWIAVGLAYRTPYGTAGAVPPRAIHAAMGILVLVLGWSYWGHAVVLIAVGGGTLAAAHWMKGRLGGQLPGDVYGFLIVATEIAIVALLPLTSP
jgi:adenosylcobinamide-GDP ribazoletransferase